jgi:ribosomal protein S18 acetylase RimI-like enzyme
MPPVKPHVTVGADVSYNGCPPSIATLVPVTITIRPARAVDLGAVAAVHTRARTEAYAGIVPAEALRAVSADAMAQWWAQRWGHERSTHRMAVAVDRTAGVVGFTYVGPSQVAGTGELYAIHVDPDRQGTGIGRALMRGALATLAELGESRAELWVLAENSPARRFYERGGWLGDGAERRAPVGPALTRQLRYSRAIG